MNLFIYLYPWIQETWRRENIPSYRALHVDSRYVREGYYLLALFNCFLVYLLAHRSIDLRSIERKYEKEVSLIMHASCAIPYVEREMELERCGGD